MNDTNINNTLVNIEIPDAATDLAQKVYEDAAKQTVEETGKILGRLPRLINAVLAPLDTWILNKEYNIAETKKLLEIKLQNIDPEKIVTPEPYVAIPAIQAISYSMNSDELREMYANLLAKSMTTYTKESVHPTFVETIKQMSPVDAKVFKHLSKERNSAMVYLKHKFESGGYDILATNITGLSFAPHNILAASIDNLEKLKLIRIPFDEYLTSDSPYQKIYDSNEYKSLLKLYRGSSWHLEPEKKTIRTTSLGKQFCQICIQ